MGPALRRSASRRRCAWLCGSPGLYGPVWLRRRRAGAAAWGSGSGVLSAAHAGWSLGAQRQGRDTPHLCRCRPLFLNREVQVGTVGAASGFPLGGGHAQQLCCLIPWVAIRLKKIPRPLSSTTGGVWVTGYTLSSEASSAGGSLSSSDSSGSAGSKTSGLSPARAMLTRSWSWRRRFSGSPPEPECGHHRDAVGADDSASLTNLAHPAVEQSRRHSEVILLVILARDPVLFVQDLYRELQRLFDHRFSSIARNLDSMASTRLRACSVFSISSLLSTTKES